MGLVVQIYEDEIEQVDVIVMNYSCRHSNNNQIQELRRSTASLPGENESSDASWDAQKVK